MFASIPVDSITSDTAPCSAPPSEVKSFWYSISTIAVVAGGIDVTYPPENADLQRAIAERLELRRPIYRGTTNYGPFGRAGLPWEA